MINLKIVSGYLICVGGIIASCGPKSDRLESMAASAPSRSDIIERVNQLVSEKKECNDQKNRLLHDSCMQGEQKWSNSDFNWKKSGSTVLVMELKAPTLLTLGRYKNRMRDVLKLNSDGVYSTNDAQKIVISRGLIEIMESTSKLDPYFSSKSFSKLGETIQDVFEDDFNLFEVGHGLTAFSVIGEYSPSSSLVFAPPPLAPGGILCAKNWPALNRYIENASASFASKISENDVSVVNMSGGDDRPTLKKYFGLVCPGASLSREDENTYLSIVGKFYSGLESLSNVVVVQSAVGQQNAEDYPMDCQSNGPKNRLRVNFALDSSNIEIPKLGASVHNGFEHLFAQNRDLDKECTDLYLNSGSDNKGNFNRESIANATGFHSQRITLMYTSWIAPLASAFILSQKNSLFIDQNGKQIVESILKPGFPAIYDPLGNGQLETFE